MKKVFNPLTPPFDQIPDSLTDLDTRQHSDLTGLTSGDPHTQYAKKAGDTMTGSLTFDDDAYGVVNEDSAGVQWREGVSTEGRLTGTALNASITPASIIQSAINQATTPNPGTVTATFAASGTATAGNRLVMIMSWTQDPGSVTATGWTLETTITPSGNQPIVKIYTKSAAGGETGGTTSWTDVAPSTSIYVAELANIDSSTYLDVAIVSANSGSSGVTTITAGPTSTSSANALAIAFATHIGSTTSFAWDGASGVSVDQSATRMNVGKKVISSPSTLTVAPTWTTSRRTIAAIITFRTGSEDPTSVVHRKQAIKTKTTSYTLRSSDDCVVMNGTSLTATLPTAVGRTGLYLTIKNINSSTLTVATTSAQTVDGTTPGTIAQWGCNTYLSDGLNWLLVSSM